MRYDAVIERIIQDRPRSIQFAYDGTGARGKGLFIAYGGRVALSRRLAGISCPHGEGAPDRPRCPRRPAAGENAGRL